MTETYRHYVIISVISPYCLPWATLPLNRQKREMSLRNVGHSIHAAVPDLGAPCMVPIQGSEFATRKKFLLKFDVGMNGLCANHVRNFDQLPWARHSFIGESIYYFDCGAGFTEVRCKIDFNSFDDLSKNRAQFRDHYKALMRSFSEENKLFHLLHWDDLANAFRRAFSDLSISFDEWLLQYADKNYGWGENFFFFSNDDDVENHGKTIGPIVNSLLSDVLSIRDIWVDRFDLLISAQNYDGGFYVMREVGAVDSAVLHIGISSTYWCIFKSSYESLLRRYENLPVFGQKAYQFEHDFTSLQASRIFLDYCISDSSPRLLAWINLGTIRLTYQDTNGSMALNQELKPCRRKPAN